MKRFKHLSNLIFSLILLAGCSFQTNNKNNENQEITAYSFQADRQLVQKLMEQREILSNRQEFLKQEQVAITREKLDSLCKSLYSLTDQKLFLS